MYKESVCRLDDRLIATIIVFLHFSRSRCTRIVKVWRGKKQLLQQFSNRKLRDVVSSKMSVIKIDRLSSWSLRWQPKENNPSVNITTQEVQTRDFYVCLLAFRLSLHSFAFSDLHAIIPDYLGASGRGGGGEKHFPLCE